jgi:hypothetical protein
MTTTIIKTMQHSTLKGNYNGHFHGVSCRIHGDIDGNLNGNHNTVYGSVKGKIIGNHNTIIKDVHGDIHGNHNIIKGLFGGRIDGRFNAVKGLENSTISNNNTTGVVLPTSISSIPITFDHLPPSVGVEKGCACITGNTIYNSVGNTASYIPSSGYSSYNHSYYGNNINIYGNYNGRTITSHPNGVPIYSGWQNQRPTTKDDSIITQSVSNIWSQTNNPIPSAPPMEMNKKKEETKIPTHKEQGIADENTENLCKICQERLIKTVNIPCGHLCYCLPCVHMSYQLTKIIKCPLCRTPLKQIIETF